MAESSRFQRILIFLDKLMKCSSALVVFTSSKMEPKQNFNNISLLGLRNSRYYVIGLYEFRSS